VINNRMTNLVFQKFEAAGIPTHFIEELNDRETAVKKVDIVPLEVIIRNVAAGSFSKRMGVEEGRELLCPILEFSYKNDDLGDPFINDYYAENGEWHPEANTVNPTNGLDEPIFIDLTYDGVEEQETVANVKVWSADHEFVIENDESTHFMMTVYNILGQPMMQKQINAGSTERISHSLAAGVYVIRMENNLNKVSVKVIVK